MSARAILALAATACFAHADDEASAKATALVRQLGDDSFEVRGRASLELLAMGHAAEDAVRKGQSDADAEVSSRCKAILPQLVKARLEGRIKAFLAGGKASLPGWELFAKLAGGDAAARKQFAELFRSQGDLLESPDRGIVRAKAEFAKRCRALRLRVVTPRRDATLLAEVVALLVVGCDPRIEADAATWDKLLDGLDTLAARREMAEQVRKLPTTRKLLAAVFRQRRAVLPLDRTLPLALALELPEAVGLALEVALDPKSPATARAWALVLLGKLGDKSLVPKLLPLLADKTPVGTRVLDKDTLRAELRDVALAAVVQLSGGKLDLAGFPYPAAMPALNVVPSPACLGFATEAQRAAAFAKWRKASDS
jgi:hypothetical protein